MLLGFENDIQNEEHQKEAGKVAKCEEHNEEPLCHAHNWNSHSCIWNVFCYQKIWMIEEFTNFKESLYIWYHARIIIASICHTNKKDFTSQEVLAKLFRLICKKNFLCYFKGEEERCLITVRKFERKIQFLNEKFSSKFWLWPWHVFFILILFLWYLILLQSN